MNSSIKYYKKIYIYLSNKRTLQYYIIIKLYSMKHLITFSLRNCFQLKSIYILSVESKWNQSNEQVSSSSFLFSCRRELAWKSKRDKKEKKKESSSSEENKMGRKWRRGSKANILPAGATNRQLLGFEHVLLPPCAATMNLVLDSRGW